MCSARSNHVPLAARAGAPRSWRFACGQLLGAAHGFAGNRERYDDPDNSMLDLVLARRRGLPILLSVVYIEVARRGGIPLAGVGLPAISWSATSTPIRLCCSIPSPGAGRSTEISRPAWHGGGELTRSRCE